MGTNVVTELGDIDVQRHSHKENTPQSRRALLSSGIKLGAGAALLMSTASIGQTAETHEIKEYDISTNGITLHVTEIGQGEAVLFCHGFPDTAYTWRKQMRAVAAAGYRAVAPDMRGFGRSSAPDNANLYTPLQTTGDLVGLLDELHIPSTVIVGHDWGASAAWGAALMRPDRFRSVFCLTVPYLPRGDVSFMEFMRQTGHQNDFYIFEQCKPEADQIWADAAVTIPGVLYWASGSAPAGQRWSPMHPSLSLYRPAPGPLPAWADLDYVAFNIAEFQQTGFHGGLNYYRAFEPYFALSSAYKGAKITQPSFYMSGKLDGLDELYPLWQQHIQTGLPGLVDYVELNNVGHWLQREASAEVSKQLINFVRTTAKS